MHLQQVVAAPADGVEGRARLARGGKAAAKGHECPDKQGGGEGDGAGGLDVACVRIGGVRGAGEGGVWRARGRLRAWQLVLQTKTHIIRGPSPYSAGAFSLAQQPTSAHAAEPAAAKVPSHVSGSRRQRVSCGAAACEGVAKGVTAASASKRVCCRACGKGIAAARSDGKGIEAP